MYLTFICFKTITVYFAHALHLCRLPPHAHKPALICINNWRTVFSFYPNLCATFYDAKTQSILKYETFCWSKSRGGHKYDQRAGAPVLRTGWDSWGCSVWRRYQGDFRAPSTVLKGLQESWRGMSDKGMECDRTRGNGLNCHREGLD